MIKICDMTYLKRHAQDPGTTGFAIVRSMKYAITGASQLSILSPSKGLFYDYLDLSRAGEWNAEAFKTRYVPRFVREIAASPEARNMLKNLKNHSDQGEIILLACFCKDEQLCHRSIIAGILAAMGAQVETNLNIDYTPYANLYKQACANIGVEAW